MAGTKASYLKFPELPQTAVPNKLVADIIRIHLNRFSNEPRLWDSDWGTPACTQHVRSALGLSVDLEAEVAIVLAIYQQYYNNFVRELVQLTVPQGRPVQDSILDLLVR